MKKNNQGFIQIILTLVVVALIGGAYYFGTLKPKQNIVVETPTEEPIALETQKPNIPTVKPIIKPTNDPTANWKVYTNTTNNYSIKYPSNLTTQVNAPSASIAEAPMDANMIYIYEKGSSEPYLNRYIDVAVLNVIPTISEKDWMQEQVNIGNFKATKLSPVQNNTKFEIYYIKSLDNRIFEIYVTRDLSKRNLAIDILSTFKFTK